MCVFKKKSSVDKLVCVLMWTLTGSNAWIKLYSTVHQYTLSCLYELHLLWKHMSFVLAFCKYTGVKINMNNATLFNIDLALFIFISSSLHLNKLPATYGKLLLFNDRNDENLKVLAFGRKVSICSLRKVHLKKQLQSLKSCLC